MAGVSLLSVLLAIWLIVTAAFVVVMIWRALVGKGEQDVVVLGDAEAHIAEQQREIVKKVERIEAYAKTLGIASAILLVLVGVVWIYRGLTSVI